MKHELLSSISTIAGTIAVCLAVVILLGHYAVTPAATALLGVAIGCKIGARRTLRRRREMAWARRRELR